MSWKYKLGKKKKNNQNSGNYVSAQKKISEFASVHVYRLCVKK